MKKIFILFAVIMSIIMVGCEMPSNVQIPSTPSISSSTETQSGSTQTEEPQNQGGSEVVNPPQIQVITLNFNLSVNDNNNLLVYVGNITSNNRQYVAKAIECYIQDTLHFQTSMYDNKLTIENRDNAKVSYDGSIMNISNGHDALKEYMLNHNNLISNITVYRNTTNGTYSLTNPNSSN